MLCLLEDRKVVQFMLATHRVINSSGDKVGYIIDVNLNAHKIKSVNDSCINCSYC